MVAASRTEERSSFYHVSREREGKGRGHDAEEANGAAKVGEPGGGAGHGGGSNHPYTRRYETTSVPLRRSDFRPIKSPRWRGAEGEGTSARGLGESAPRAFEFHAKFGQFRRACTLQLARPAPFYHRAREMVSSFFFPPHRSPSFVVCLLFLTESRVPDRSGSLGLRPAPRKDHRR